jgi:uncharacterized NAD(P)/FAD-binding protein YdhS
MSAVNIARLSEHPIHITVIDQQRPIGRGVAYRLRRPEYLLNVAARNMSAFPNEPDHFLQWLRTRSEFEATPDVELRERFVPRQIYGDYVRSIVQHQLQSPGELSPVTADFVVGEAVDVEPGEGACRVLLADGASIDADRVVLATGNEPPAPLPGVDALVDHPAWVGNPWQAWEQQLPPDDGTIAILGTGLSAVDAIITLRALGWLGSIHAVSRHGWFPHAHFRGIEYPEFPPPGFADDSPSLDELVVLIGKHCQVLHERNANPAIIVDKLRPHTQRLWSSFSTDDRVRFAKEHAARWNVFRHRIAPDIHAQLASSQLTGQLQVHASAIEEVRESGNRIRVELEGGQTLEADLVLNATGPSTKITATQSVLIQNLLARGLVTPDQTNMGVSVDPDHNVLTDDGARSPWLLALGPMLRGTYWETIAVPELRGQARRVAETVLGSEHGSEQEAQLQLEYMI